MLIVVGSVIDASVSSVGCGGTHTVHHTPKSHQPRGEIPIELEILGGGDRVSVDDCTVGDLAGSIVYRAPDGRWLAPAFRGHAVDLGPGPLPDPADEDAFGDLVLGWVETVRAHDWSDLRGSPLDSDEDWLDLRSAMVRVGWGPGAAQAAWQACRDRPYARELPTAAGWAAAGWVVPAVADEPQPCFATPVLEARGLLRWTYIVRWSEPVPLPDGPLPIEPEPTDLGWADVLSRVRQDHHTEESLLEAEQLAVEILELAGLGPRNPIEAEDDPLPDRDVAAAVAHPSGVVRAAAWFLLRDEAETWLACTYSECQHHWAVEAEEDAYEMEEVLELASHGVANPVDAAYTRRRLLTLAFGDVKDVPLAGAGDVEDFIAFYEGWVAHGRPEEDFEDAARELRGDE
jgi:hypothetical protein